MRTFHWVGWAVLGAVAASAQLRPVRPESSPILDGEREPSLRVELGVVPTETIENSSESFGWVELSGLGSLGYYRTLAGDFDLLVHARLWQTIEGDRYEVPDLFGMCYLRARWDLRLPIPVWPEPALRVDVMPGYYAELEHVEWDDFNIPVAASLIGTADRTLAGQLGLAFYPGFENYFDPIARVRWVPHPTVAVDVGYPRTAVIWSPYPQIAIEGGWELNRVWQFSLARADHAGDFMYRDQRAFVGLGVEVAPGFKTWARVFWLAKRELDFEAGPFQDAKVDDGVMWSLGSSWDF